jgi:FHA domain
MTSGKTCLVCNHKNVDSALVCSFCGASLEGKQTDPMAVTEYVGTEPNLSAEAAAAFIDLALIPEGEVGIYIPGAPKALYAPVHKELILGRQTGTVLKDLLDLTEFDAFNQGVSRRHAALRPTQFGFEVIDLSSQNGTWLNGMQLVPQKPYPLANGSQLRLCRLQLVVMYHIPGRKLQKR